MRRLSLEDVRDHFGEAVEWVGEQDDRIVVTRAGRPVAVLIGVDELDRLEETIQVLSDGQGDSVRSD